jgi:flagellar protein FliO/FliZ
MSSYTGYIIETFVTLAIVCGLAYAVLFGARRLGVGRARGPIELVGQLPLDARRFIYLVRVGGQVYVVGAGEGGFTKLGELDAGSLPPAEKSEAFAKILAKALGRDGAASKGGDA